MTQPHMIQEQVSLAPYTTLGVGGRARYFARVTSRDVLIASLTWAREAQIRVIIIGGGSNLLVGDADINALVLHMALGGIGYEEDVEQVLVTAGAGVVLDELVRDTVSRELWGLENLTSIPGTVGGVPIQNVGAYGVEACDVIQSVEVFDRATMAFHTLTNAECQFSYRDSLFKREGKDRYVVIAVTFNLTKTPRPRLAYKDLVLRFPDPATARIHEIRDAVALIRSHKFPDWHTMGTAGSFFKNPIVDASVYERIRTQFPDIPAYPESDGRYKLSLGWILDKVLSYKGYRVGNVGLYHEQALVLVNHGGATAREIHTFSDAIVESVEHAIGVRVEREVVMLT